MKTPRIYIDNSVIGGCFDDEFSYWSNALMEDFKRGFFLPVVSVVVEREAKLQGAPPYVADQYDWLVEQGAEVLPLNKQVIELADVYEDRTIVSPKYYDDALHIALATVAEVDILVSWNFRHIVHYDKIRRFNAASQELGYKPVAIHTPREVTTREKDESREERF